MFAHLAELEVLRLDGLLDQMVLLWHYLDRWGGGGRLLQAVQDLPDVELLHFFRAQTTELKGMATFLSLRGPHTRTTARSPSSDSGLTC